MKKRILVVDNHPVMLKFMNSLLTKNGYEVRVTEDGLSALDMLKVFIPDVVFIDLIMPNICGEKLCRILRKTPELEQARLVILSGIAADKEINYKELGADACIAKGPFSEMGGNILDVLDKLEVGTVREKKTVVLGARVPREITRELLSVKNHFEVVLESMNDGILEITSRGRIVYANPAALSITGLAEENILASIFSDLFPAGDRARIHELLSRSNGCSQSFSEESPVLINERQVRVKILPIQAEEAGAIVVLDDITERVRMEKRLQHARKMEVVGDLAAAISNDFNNILMVIMGNISLAKKYAHESDKLLERLDHAENGASRAKMLVQQLLPLTKGGAPVRQEVKLSPIIRHVCHSMMNGNDPRIHLSIPEDLWAMHADPHHIEQAFGNLIANAVEAMEGGGSIRVIAENIFIQKGSALPLDSGPYVRVSVRDQGIGIPANQLPHIFDPFFSTRGFGRGIGLATVYSIIKRHHGHIEVESEPDADTVFHIYLPAMKQEILSDCVEQGGMV